jgi:hypothetical protein
MTGVRHGILNNKRKPVIPPVYWSKAMPADVESKSEDQGKRMTIILVVLSVLAIGSFITLVLNMEDEELVVTDNTVPAMVLPMEPTPPLLLLEFPPTEIDIPVDEVRIVPIDELVSETSD